MPRPKVRRASRPPSSTTKARAGLPPATASEAAFERLLAHFDDIAESRVDARGHALDVEPAAAPAEVAGSEDRTFLDDLFSHKSEYLVRDRFATIGAAESFYTKIVGVSFEGRQDRARGLTAGESLELVREPHNAHDPNAIAVRYGNLQLGYLQRGMAKWLAPNIDGGERYTAIVGSLTGGGERYAGVNIFVRRLRPVRAVARAEAARASVATDDLRVALIGERPEREAQRAVLARLAAGRNTLAVLGTGRGKSFCFQLPAAGGALAEGKKTLVFYPLRALANDQYAALSRRLEHFGLRILRANGSIDAEQRAELDAALDEGAWDIILTTPEFATYHRDAFARTCNRPHLVVVDEAHHLYESRHRQAYAALGELIRSLGGPQVLALTATAGDDAFREIRRALDVDAWVIDPTVRDNLHLVDARNTGDKFGYLARALGGDEKAIVYCTSRSEVTKVADRLRNRFGSSVAFYHAGVPSPERLRVEDLFRRGVVRTIVATSAFGEGIDLPDVRDVVLYHLNFNFTEFNQMAGRAGRDGLDARIHLLFGEGDRRINEYIIAKSAPSLEVLRELYRGMRSLAHLGTLRAGYEDIARTLALDMVGGETVNAAVESFVQAGLAETGSDDDGRFVRFLDVAAKVDLTKTARYAEGLAERDAFARFCALVLTADVETLEQIVNRPIYPDRVPLEA